MPYDPEKHHRRSIRLRGYDYGRPGWYFVTVCLQKPIDFVLGQIRNDEMRLNENGSIVAQVWENLPHHYPSVKLDAFVVMPDHIHGVLVLTNGMGSDVGVPSVGVRFNRAPTENPPTKCGITLGQIVHDLKSFSTRKINETRGTAGTRIWQRDFYERIIRDVDELNRVRQYISDNPRKWRGLPEP